MAVFRKVYSSLPQWVRTIVGSVYHSFPTIVRYGKQYSKKRKFLSYSQYWSSEEHEEYQLKRIRYLLLYCESHIPYYKQLFTRIGFSPSAIKKLTDISVIPVMDKNTVEQHFNELISDCVKSDDWIESTTGGTSGHQLRFLIPKSNYNSRERAFVDTIWARIGVRQNSRIAVLRNQVLNNKLFVKDSAHHRYIFDSYHLTPDNIVSILETIKRLRIEYIHTYPSLILILAEKAEQLNFSSNYLKAILATSENLYPGQREYLERVFNCRVFSFYGHSEGGVIAGECEFSNLYHIQSEYGYVELIDKNGNVITEPGVMGEIVCTGFDNSIMPLIRYRTGDFSSYSTENTCQCGRHYKLLNGVNGRWTQEVFIGKEGNKIAMASINMHSAVFDNVLNYQFLQEEKGLCTLFIVKSEKYTNHDEEAIISELEKKFAGSISICIKYVESISRTNAGKQRFIIQRIKG